MNKNIAFLAWFDAPRVAFYMDIYFSFFMMHNAYCIIFSCIFCHFSKNCHLGFHHFSLFYRCLPIPATPSIRHNISPSFSSSPSPIISHHPPIILPSSPLMRWDERYFFICPQPPPLTQPRRVRGEELRTTPSLRNKLERQRKNIGGERLCPKQENIGEQRQEK